MGETEDEFARAEALLAELERRDGVSQPVPVPEVPATPPQAIEATSQDFDFEEIVEAPEPEPVEEIPVQPVAVETATPNLASKYRLGAHYRIPQYIFEALEGRVGGREETVMVTDTCIFPRRIENRELRRLRSDSFTYGDYIYIYVLEKTDVAMKVSVGLRIRSIRSEDVLRTVPGTDGWPVYHTWIRFDKLVELGFEESLTTTASDRDRFAFTRVNVDPDLLVTAYNQEMARLLKEELKQKQAKKKAEEEYDTTLSTIAELAEEIYPGNTQLYSNYNAFKWSSIRDKFASMNLHKHAILLIRFPEIIIENRDKRKHTIKDLYVSLHFGLDERHNFFMNSNLYGARATVTSAEWYSNYRHSHLQTGRDPYFVNFCQGGGTPTSIATAELRSNFSMEKFELFLYQLSSYVRYESLEGGPYIRMENIRDRSSSRRNIDVNDDMTRYMNFVRNNNVDLPVKTAVIDGEERFVFDDKDPEFLQQLGALTRTPFTRLANGTFQQIDEQAQLMSENDKRQLSRELFLFRDEVIKFKVEDPQVLERQDSQKYPAPAATLHIKKTLEEELNLYYILKESYELS